MLLGHVVSGFERDRKVEVAVEPKRLAEVAREKLRRLDSKRLRLDVRPIDPQDVVDAVLAKDLQPGARPAADVHNAHGVEALDDDRHDGSRGTLCRVALPFEVG